MTAAKPTERYRPSNGTEGAIFRADWCDQCAKDRDPAAPCAILSSTLIYDVFDPEYPAEWICDVGPWPGNPRCTAFEHVDAEYPSTFIRDGRQIGLQL